MCAAEERLELDALWETELGLCRDREDGLGALFGAGEWHLSVHGERGRAGSLEGRGSGRFVRVPALWGRTSTLEPVCRRLSSSTTRWVMRGGDVLQAARARRDASCFHPP